MPSLRHLQGALPRLRTVPLAQAHSCPGRVHRTPQYKDCVPMKERHHPGHSAASFSVIWASLVAQTVKNLPTMRETHVGSLDWEDALEMEMATHSGMFVWEIP